MEIYRFITAHGQKIDRYGSVGALVAPVIQSGLPLSVVFIQLEAHGRLGAHPAAADQLFIIVSGEGYVSVQGQGESFISSGSMVFWHKGEIHQTRAGAHGLLAIVIEGEGLGQSSD